MEHLQHFGLSQDPFSNEPDLRFYFDSACHRDAKLRLERALRQHKSLTMLTGDAGTGKSLLARRLLESLEEEVFEVCLMVMLPGATDAQTVLGRFARQLGAEDPGEERAAILASIYEQLAIVREDGRHAVLIIDDAHILGPDVIAEICGLLNMEYEDKRLLSLLLVGSPELDGCMAGDAAMLQRVDVRVQLQTLDLDNTAAYLAHRLTVVGGAIPLLPSPTIEVLFKYSRGRPRLLNTLSDNALFEAYLGGRTTVGAGDVERAARDLGIGVDPGTTHTQLAPVPGVTPPQDFASAAPAPPPAAPVATGAPDAAAVVGEITDPDSGPAWDTGSGLKIDPGSSADDLGALLEAAVAPGAGETVDLDAEVEAVLAEREPDAELGELPIFSAQNQSEPAGAEATRIALPEEEPLADDGEVTELDDLFVELIEE